MYEAYNNWNFRGWGGGLRKNPFRGGYGYFLELHIGVNWSWDMIVFIHGETLSAHSACPRKIPGWIAVFQENVSVN